MSTPTLQSGYDRINAALQVLYEEGLTHIKPEYQKDYPRYQAIGLAIASVNQSSKDVLNLAYSAMEDFNAHGNNLVLEWAFNLYDSKFHERDLVTLRRAIEKNHMTIFSEWDPAEGGRYKTKVINVRLVFEDVTESEEVTDNNDE